MKPTERKVFRCAIYTRKSTEHNLDLEFNSLDAQREASEAYIKSQAHEGWRLKRKIPGEDGSDRVRLLGHHDELFVDGPIAKRDRSPDPDALALGGRDLIGLQRLRGAGLTRRNVGGSRSLRVNSRI